MKREENLVFLLGPTNTGKTHYAIEKMLTFSNGVIGLPLRLLAREVYDKVASKVGKLKVALITGEEQITPLTAKYFVTTVESMPSERSFEFLAVDEIQLCNDFERGHIFTDRLLNSRGTLETLFLGSETMEKITKSIFSNCRIVKKQRRSTLSFIGKKGLLSLPKRSAIIAFNSNDVYSIASKLKTVKGGAAVVMGSLSPQTRNSQVSIFEEETVDYIVATDAIGMGLNLNIKNISFSSLNKFDGKENRSLNNSEIGQIAGRAGRNSYDGSFSTTLNCRNMSSESIKSVENHNFDSNEFLFWRESKLDFSSIYNLIKSLEKKSDDPRLVKTQNKRDENTLKYLSNINIIQKRLQNESSIKLLWDISLIPDYFKNLDSMYSELLIKIFCNIVDNGFLNTSWAISETKKLQNVEGTIDMLTFRLAKTRFWNYISNRNQWTNNNQELKNLALKTEGLLSDALHERLTNEFVDKKISQLIKSYNIKKTVEISIDKNNRIYLNEKIIGSISGFQVNIYEEKSLFKNKFLKEEITKKVKKLLENYAKDFLSKTNLNITIDSKADLFFNSKKIGSIYKGESIFNPNIMKKNNNYLSEKIYKRIEEKVKIDRGKKIDQAFWSKDYFLNIESRDIKTFLFSLEKNLGIIKRNEIDKSFIPKNSIKKKILLKKGVLFANYHFFIKKVVDTLYKDLRWTLSCLYFNVRVLNRIPKEKIILDAKSYKKELLHSIGYVKTGAFAIDLIFLEKIIYTVFRKKKRIFYFDFNILNKYNIAQPVLFEILDYVGLYKVAGTSYVSYWRRKKTMKKEAYNENSPFYILKKLQ